MPTSSIPSMSFPVSESESV